MDHVDFVSPIDLGEVVVIDGYVFNTGRSNIDARVDVRAEDPTQRDRRLATTSFFTFVAINGNGRPTEVPDVECSMDEEARLRDAAIEARREQLEQVTKRLGETN